MKRKTSHWVLLALALSIALLLAACGASGSAAEGSQQEESVTGTINRLDTDYLVLITDDVEYLVMDFGESFSVEGFSEGDDVVITYTGTSYLSSDQAIRHGSRAIIDQGCAPQRILTQEWDTRPMACVPFL